MRTLVAGVAIAAVALALLIFALPAGSGEPIGAAAGNLEIGKPFYAHFGGELAVIIPYSAQNRENYSIFARTADTPFTRQAYWAEGTSAGANQAPQIRKYLQDELGSAGMRLNGITGWQELGDGAVVITASGALPGWISQGLLNGSFPEQGQILAYVGVPDGSVILEDGSVGSDPKLAGMFDSGQKGNFTFESPGGGKVVVFPKVPDEYEPSLIARGIYEKAFLMEEGEWGQELRLQEGRGAAVLSEGMNKTYVRVLTGGQKVLVFGPISPLPGEINGPSEAGLGESAVFRISAEPYGQGKQDADMLLCAYGLSGKLSWKRKIGEMNGSGRWVGAEKVDAWPEYGGEILQLEDQFGRQYARAYVSTPRLEAKLTYDGGREKEFLLLKDGKPLEGARTLARTAGTEFFEVPLSGGKALLQSKWQEGNNTVEFKSGGLSTTYSWNEGGGAASVYLRYGLPGLAFAAALYLILRRDGNRPYIIRTGAHMRLESKKIGKRELFQKLRRLENERAGKVIWKEDINRRLAEEEGWGASDESLSAALGSLERDGKLRRSVDGYTTGSKDERELRRAVLCSKIMDMMILEGVTPENCGRGRVRAKQAADDITWQAHVNGEKISLPRKGRLALVFENEAEVSDFKKWMESGVAAGSKLAIAHMAGKLLLKSADGIRKAA